MDLIDVRDFTAGVISNLSFGATDWLLGQMGDLGEFDPCSESYSNGEWAGAIGAVAAGGKGLLNLGKGFGKKGGNYVAKNLTEQLAMKEARNNGARIMKGEIKDFRYPEWLYAKTQFIHRGLDGTNTTVHYWRNLLTGIEHGYKIK